MTISKKKYSFFVTLFAGVLVIIIALVLMLVAFLSNRAEGFELQWFGQRTQCPTRNMSYDLRGDIVQTQRSNTAFMQATIGPIDPYACT